MAMVTGAAVTVVIPAVDANIGGTHRGQEGYRDWLWGRELGERGGAGDRSGCWMWDVEKM